MQVLSRECYTGWRDISSDALRYWIRLWQDGFNPSTHPEWAFNPLTLSGLGRLWPLFAPVPRKRDWTQSQRHAIRVLAARRASFPDGKRFTCPTGNGDAEWDNYWMGVSDANPAFRGELYEQLSALLSSMDAPDFGAISKVTAVLVGELLLEGYSDSELWIRAVGILDPKPTIAKPSLDRASRPSRTMPHLDRALGLLDHLKRKPTKEYVVWTNILRNGQPLSTVSARRVAPWKLQSPEEWKGSEGFVRIDGSARAISRVISTHSLTACLNHRVSVSEHLRARSATLGIPGLGPADATSIRQLGLPNTRGWQHTVPRMKNLQHLPLPNPSIEPGPYAAAIDILHDDPEEVIRLLCDAFERKLGTHWPEPAGQAYIKRLRAVACSRLASAIGETCARWKEDPAAPTWLGKIPRDQLIDFAQAACLIRQSGQDADYYLAEKLELAGRHGAQFGTPGLVTGWLHLAKGIRNREVHAGSWPLELRCVAAFLARLLLWVFVTVFPEPDPQAA